MFTLVTEFQTKVDDFVNTFLVEVSKKYSVNLEKLRSDWSSYSSSQNPKNIASKINDLTDESESSTQVETKVLDDSSEESLQIKPPVKKVITSTNNVVFAQPAANSEDNSESEPAKKSTESSKEDEISKEESEDEPPKKTKKSTKNSKEESEDEPPKKTKKSTKKDEQPKKVVKNSIETVDQPKTKDLTVPAGAKFLKGTNNVVVDGKVVAMCTKKGVVPLGAPQLKSLTSKNTPHDKWDATKIKKHFKM